MEAPIYLLRRMTSFVTKGRTAWQRQIVRPVLFSACEITLMAFGDPLRFFPQQRCDGELFHCVHGGCSELGSG